MESELSKHCELYISSTTASLVNKNNAVSGKCKATMRTTLPVPLLLAALLLLLTPLSTPIPDYAMASAYLTKYGYLAQSHSTHSSSLQTLDAAISKLQAFAGLEQTGEIDRETEQVIRMRRCWVNDIQEDDQVRLGRLTQLSGSSRRKWYALQGSR